MSPPAENAHPKMGAPETIIAGKRQSESNASPRHQQALARAGALAVVAAATASGVFEPTPKMLDSTAALASSLHWDIWVEVSS